jgi:hypothetical protein
LAAEVLVAEREQVEGHERSRSLRREQLHPRRRGMDPEQQRLEVEPRAPHDHDLSVEDAPLRQRGEERVDELREVTVHRLEVAALEHHLAPVAEDDGAEPVPLGLEQPLVARGQRVGGLRQHGLDRRLEGKLHRRSLAW